MLPVLERFGGKPVRCLFNNNEQQPSCVTEEAANSSSSKPPAYIWDFARMREACLPAAVGRKKQPLLAVATPSNDTAVQGEEDKAALIPQQQASLALVPVTVTEGAAAMEEEEEDEDDDDGASGAATASDYGPLPAYLQEKRHRFSRAPLRHLQMAGALGLVNLVGAMWLLDQWRAFPPPVAAVLYPISRALALYAWTFLLLPLLRLALIARWNRALARRNALRRSLHEAFKTQAADAESEVCRKLEWAARYRAHVAGAGVRF